MRHNPTNNGRRLRNRGPNNGSNNGSNNRRPGGGGGHSGSGNRNQVFDSNGPDVRIRGTAFQIQEKYATLAKDAATSGDLIVAESYLQHAEHYQRIINSWGDQQAYNRPQPAYGDSQPGDDEDQDDDNDNTDREQNVGNGNGNNTGNGHGNPNGHENGHPNRGNSSNTRFESRRREQQPSEDDLGLPPSITGQSIRQPQFSE